MLWTTNRRRTKPKFDLHGRANVEAMVPTFVGVTEGAFDRGNRVEILQNGAFFDRLLDDIARAKSTRGGHCVAADGLRTRPTSSQSIYGGGSCRMTKRATNRPHMVRFNGPNRHLRAASCAASASPKASGLTTVTESTDPAGVTLTSSTTSPSIRALTATAGYEGNGRSIACNSRS